MPSVGRNEVLYADDSTARKVAAVDSAGQPVALATAGQFGAGRTVQRAAVDVSAAGDNELVPAVAGQSVKVLGLLLMAEAAVDATLYAGPSASGTALTGPMPLASGGGFVLPAPAVADLHWLAGAADASLVVKLSDAVQVSGMLLYVQE